MNKKLVRTMAATTLALSMFTSVVSVAFAQEGSSNTSGKSQEEIEKFKEEQKKQKEAMLERLKKEKEGKVAVKCEMIESRVSEKITRFNNNKDGHIVRYNKLKDNLTRIINKLSEKGLDVTELKADLQTLDTKIKKFSTDYQAYITKLGQTKGFACGNSEGNFKSKLEESRSALKLVLEDAKDIQKFYKDEIKPDIQKLREQLKQKEEETE